MKRKMTWIAFLVIGGLPIACAVVCVVAEAIGGNWIPVNVIVGVLWAVVLSKLALDLACPDDQQKDGKPDSSEKE
jgi:hypothetical protein